MAETGDREAERTIVLMAHHDAAPTGLHLRRHAPSARLNDVFPDLIERTDTAVPMWWPVIAGPALSALGAATGRRGLARVGLVLSAGSAASFADIARDRIVPGANDNLSGVAVLVAVAESLEAKPVEGLRVLLASCGAEEVLQGGVYGFVERHLKPLDPKQDVGAEPRHGRLAAADHVEGEGPVVMEDYCGPEFRDLVARVAEEAGVELRRNMRARTSTDAVVPSHAGYPTATIASMTRGRACRTTTSPRTRRRTSTTRRSRAPRRWRRPLRGSSLARNGREIRLALLDEALDALHEVWPLKGLEHQLVRLVRGG